MKVFVLGTGGWGIALAMLLHQNGHEVTSWTYQQAECDLLLRERCNEKLLPGVIIPEGIEITTDMAGAARAAGEDRAAAYGYRQRRQGSGFQARLLPVLRDHLERDERQQSSRCTDRSDACRGGCTRHSDGYRSRFGEPCGG